MWQLVLLSHRINLILCFSSWQISGLAWQPIITAPSFWEKWVCGSLHASCLVCDQSFLSSGNLGHDMSNWPWLETHKSAPSHMQPAPCKRQTAVPGDSVVFQQNENLRILCWIQLNSHRWSTNGQSLHNQKFTESEGLACWLQTNIPYLWYWSWSHLHRHFCQSCRARKPQFWILCTLCDSRRAAAWKVLQGKLACFAVLRQFWLPGQLLSKSLLCCSTLRWDLSGASWIHFLDSSAIDWIYAECNIESKDCQAVHSYPCCLWCLNLMLQSCNLVDTQHFELRRSHADCSHVW